MSNSAPHNTVASIIKADLEALQQGTIFPWGRIGRLLDLVDKSEFWRNDARSFTEWMDKHADLLGVKRSMLWRYLAGGRFYNRLRTKFPSLTRKPLEEIGDDISPENLELLAKIARSAPESIYKLRAVQLLSGEAKRSDLRATWAAFKPILDGKTARGRGVTPPKAPTVETTENDQRLQIALMKNQLATSSSWTMFKDLYIDRIFFDISLSNYFKFDAVAVTRGKNSAFLLHGIKIVLQNDVFEHHHYFRMLNETAEKCDLLWLALPSAPDIELATKIPRSIGLLVIDSSGIQTIRHPKREKPASSTEDLAKILLELVLK
jgi:hypothetical protein